MALPKKVILQVLGAQISIQKIKKWQKVDLER